MYRVLLVEDEDIIRNGLIHSIQWNKYGFEIVASAEDGDEGWKIYQNIQPDVVITDIKMPESNGIDLLKKIKKANNNTFVLLLTGYEEFEYARDGLRYGAYEYISKLNVLDVIDDTLKRLSEDLSKQSVVCNEQKELQKQMEASKLHAMIQGELSADFMEGYEFVAMVVWCGEKKEISLPTNIILLKKGNLSLYVIGVSNRHPCQISRLLQMMQERKENCGISDVYKREDGITCLYTALRDLDRKRVKAETTICDKLISKKLKRTFQDALIFEQWELIPLIFEEESFCILSDESMHLVHYRNFCRNCIIQLGQDVEEVKLNSFYSMLEMYRWVLVQIQEACQQAMKTRDREGAKDIEKAITYIENHYQEELSAAQIAESLYLTPQHFSVKFKEKTGDGFAEYVRKKRISAACELLEKTQKSIEEIAWETGYEDVKYFYRVFRKEVGVSPNEYRKENSNDL